MRFIDYIKIALKNLWRRKIRTSLTIIAVVIGSLAVVSLMSLAMGARNVFISQLESIGALKQITVFPDPEADADFFGGSHEELDKDFAGQLITEELISKINKLEHVEGSSPIIQVYQLQKANVEGGVEKEARLDNITGYRVNPGSEKTLMSGRNFTDNDEMGKIIIGGDLLKKLGYENKADEIIGKTITFKTWEGYWGLDFKLPDPEGADEETWQVIHEIEAEIIGVTTPGPDGRSSYVTETWARHLSKQQRWEWPSQEAWEAHDLEMQRLEEEARARYEEFDRSQYDLKPELLIEDRIADTGFPYMTVSVDDADNVSAVAEEIKKLGVGAVTAEEFLDGILKAFLVVEIVLGAIGSIALLVAAIGIINTMVMAIMERTREIGVMKAVGASRGTIKKLFTLEAGFIGIIGGAFGLLLGWGLGLVANMVAKRFMEDGNFSVESIIEMPLWLIFGVLGFTFLVGILSGLYPAARAAKLDPIDALRSE
ncbi:ABC transporter permease [Patescibacteria group bacterium]|nr:ABC transporter permease [Patescibacteria group bacterium]MBU1890266.1 ABC transporter permease [Patescibacteria group bacterium]